MKNLFAPHVHSPDAVPDWLIGCDAEIDQLREIGAYFHARGWSVGTSSNYSVVLEKSPLELLITASGMDKGQLRRCDFVRVGHDGQPLSDGQPKSSAETLLHVLAASHPSVGAVLHTHSVWGTLLSDHYFHQGELRIAGYEMLKGLAGVTTHQHQERIPIFDNSQDIAALAGEVAAQIDDFQACHAFLLRGHGMYTWGETLGDARRHIEVLEFLFECVARRLMLPGSLESPSQPR